MRLVNQKALREPDPRATYLERLFFRLINHNNSNICFNQEKNKGKKLTKKKLLFCFIYQKK